MLRDNAPSLRCPERYKVAPSLSDLAVSLWLGQVMTGHRLLPTGQHNPLGLNLAYVFNAVGLLTAPMLAGGHLQGADSFPVEQIRCTGGALCVLLFSVFGARRLPSRPYVALVGVGFLLLAWGLFPLWLRGSSAVVSVALLSWAVVSGERRRA